MIAERVEAVRQAALRISGSETVALGIGSMEGRFLNLLAEVGPDEAWRIMREPRTDPFWFDVWTTVR